MTMLALITAALGVPANWVNGNSADGGTCNLLVSELLPSALTGGGMGGAGYATEPPLGEVTEYEGGGYLFQLPRDGVAGWFVTAKEGTVTQTATESGTSIDADTCDSFMSYGGPGVDLTGGPSVAVWTPPAGASGTFTIEVASAPGFAQIMYHSYEITVEEPTTAPPPSPSPMGSPPSPPSPTPTEIESTPPSPPPVDCTNCVCYRRRKILFSSAPECPPECC